MHVVAIFAIVHAVDLIKCLIGYVLVRKNVWMKSIKNALKQGISLKRNRSRIGSVEQVLVTDTDDQGSCLGRSGREAPEIDGAIYVACQNARPEPGQFIPVRITDAGEYDLRGEML